MRVGTAAHPHRVQDEQLHDQRAIPGPMNEDLYDADSKAEVICPHCGEMVMILLDPGGGGRQEYVEDCEVCCRPWQVQVHYDGLGVATVALEPT